MIAAIERNLSFDEFMVWLPQDGRYEVRAFAHLTGLFNVFC
jgi:hypothetical protein